MKVFLDTVGCRLNQAEIEAMASQFRQRGHEVVAESREADLVVINTCTVTSQAASDSRQKTRQAGRVGQGRVVLTGCWSTLEPNKAGSIPGVERLITNHEKVNLVDLLLGETTGNLQAQTRQSIPGARHRTRAFIKVQDGCDNHCTYCVTVLARGKGVSTSVQHVLEEVRSAMRGGAREVVLTGVHLGSWGQDFTNKKLQLKDLIQTILDETDVPRLRLSSVEPWDLDESFFALWQDRRLCRQLHLPLQSGSAGVLRRMARKVTPQIFARLVDSARGSIPDLAVTTDLICGFPQETEEEFEETIRFVTDLRFAGGHVFCYSLRPGTAAARMDGQVSSRVSKRRSAVLRDRLHQSGGEFACKFIGRNLSVLWESSRPSGEGRWLLEGLSDNYLRVQTESSTPRWNEVDQVAVESYNDGLLRGQIISKL